MDFLDLKKEVFGLDISDYSLKIIKLKKRGRFFDLASFGRAKIKSGIVKKGEIRKPDELAEIIKKALKEVRGDKLGTRNVAVSLPEEKGFLQVIQMPRLSEEDLKSAVIFEAENHIPLPLEEAYFDYQVIPCQDHSERLDVLIAAFPKKTIDSYIDCFKKAEIKPVFLETESLAISRALVEKEKADRPVFLVNFGMDRTIFIIFDGCSARFTFSVPISSQNFTEAISRTMNINLVKAEKLKIKHGLEDKSTKVGKEVFEALVPTLTDLSEQIKKYLDYYQTYSFHKGLSSSSQKESQELSSESKKIEKILICGGEAKLKGLVHFLSSHLGIEVEIGNPWVNILSPEKQPKEKLLIYEKEESLSYVATLGLALRGIKGNKMINLLPPENKKDILQEENRKVIIILGINILLALVCLSFILYAINFFISEQVKSQKIAYEQKEKEFRLLEFHALEKNLIDFNKIISQLSSFYQQRFEGTRTLKEILETVPSRIYLTNLSVKQKDEKEKKVEIVATGFSSTREELLLFKENLEKKENFKEIYFPPSCWVKPTDINFTVNFIISKF